MAHNSGSATKEASKSSSADGELAVIVFGCPLRPSRQSTSSPISHEKSSRDHDRSSEQQTGKAPSSGVGKTFLCARFVRQDQDEFLKAVRQRRQAADRRGASEKGKPGGSLYFGSCFRVAEVGGRRVRLHYHVVERSARMPVPGNELGDCKTTKRAVRVDAPSSQYDPTVLHRSALSMMDQRVEVEGQLCCLPPRTSEIVPDKEEEIYVSSSEGERMPRGFKVIGYIGVIDPMKNTEEVRTQINFLRYTAMEAVRTNVALAVAVTKCDALSGKALADLERLINSELVVGEKVPVYYMSSVKGFGVAAAFEAVAHKGLSLSSEAPKSWPFGLQSQVLEKSLTSCAERVYQSITKEISESAVFDWWKTFRDRIIEEERRRRINSTTPPSAADTLPFRMLVTLEGEARCRLAFLEQLNSVVQRVLSTCREQRNKDYAFLADCQEQCSQEEGKQVFPLICDPITKPKSSSLEPICSESQSSKDTSQKNSAKTSNINSKESEGLYTCLTKTEPAPYTTLVRSSQTSDSDPDYDYPVVTFRARPPPVAVKPLKREGEKNVCAPLTSKAGANEHQQMRRGKEKPSSS